MPTPVFFSQSNYTVKESSYYNPIYGNYSFDVDLTNFGVIKERKFRKVNRIQSILKLKDDKDTKSIFPMLDEFGYSVSDFFMFKSTWDYEYHIETLESTNPYLTYRFKELKFYNKRFDNFERTLIDWEREEPLPIGRPIVNIRPNRNDFI